MKLGAPTWLSLGNHSPQMSWATNSPTLKFYCAAQIHAPVRGPLRNTHHPMWSNSTLMVAKLCS